MMAASSMLHAPLRPGHYISPCHSLSVGIIFVSYSLQVRFSPYLDPSEPMTPRTNNRAGFIGNGMQLVYVRHTRGARGRVYFVFNSDVQRVLGPSLVALQLTVKFASWGFVDGGGA